MAIARSGSRFSLVLAVVVVVAAGCAGGERGAPAGRAEARPGNVAAVSACPDAAWISSTIGFSVRSMSTPGAAGGGAMLCAYQATDPALGAFVSIAAAPLAPGEDPLADVQAAAATYVGAQGAAEPIDVGERGCAYGSGSKSEAAAIRSSRVYRVDVTATRAIGDRKAAVVAILRKVVG